MCSWFWQITPSHINEHLVCCRVFLSPLSLPSSRIPSSLLLGPEVSSTASLRVVTSNQGVFLPTVFCMAGSPCGPCPGISQSVRWSAIGLFSAVSHVWLFCSLLSMGFPRQEYWSGLSFPSPGESYQPRDWIHVSRIGRAILYHWATQEAPALAYWKSILSPNDKLT